MRVWRLFWRNRLLTAGFAYDPSFWLLSGRSGLKLNISKGFSGEELKFSADLRASGATKFGGLRNFDRKRFPKMTQGRAGLAST